MRNLLTILLITLQSTISFGQEISLEYKKILFQGLPFESKKDEIIEAFGIPKIVDPEYECGFYANSQPGSPYEQLIYNSFNFIGNAEENYILEEITFDDKAFLELQFDGLTVNGKTSKEKFIELFGTKAKVYFDDNIYADSIKLYPKDQDSALIFIFENDLLFRIKYWSPC
jgi:hypothetical protein